MPDIHGVRREWRRLVYTTTRGLALRLSPKHRQRIQAQAATHTLTALMAAHGRVQFVLNGRVTVADDRGVLALRMALREVDTVIFEVMRDIRAKEGNHGSP